MTDDRPISERASVPAASPSSYGTSPSSSPPPSGIASAECAAPSLLSAKLAVLAGRTVPRVPLDDDIAAEVLRCMATMLSRFSANVALAAIERWPSTPGGKFFPTENELRELCGDVQRSVRQPSRTPPPQPSEFTEEHRTLMKQKLKALSMAMAAANGRPVSLEGCSDITKAEFASCQALFAKRRVGL